MTDARARNTDPETSHEAAASVRNLSLTQSRVFYLLRTYGEMTDEGIAAKWGQHYDAPISPSGLRSRRSELIARGLVEFSGEWGDTLARRRSRKWRAT